MKTRSEIRTSFEEAMRKIQLKTGIDEKNSLLLANGPEWVESMWNKYAALYEAGYTQALTDIGLPPPKAR